jgi:Predicted transcriptional regulators
MIERMELPIDSLVVDPLQSRSQAWAGDDHDQRLAASIDDDGLYHDLLVRPLDAVDVGVTNDTTDSTAENHNNSDRSQYAIIAGSRRYHAAMEAGHEKLPCKILTANDLNAAWASLNENTERRELSEQEIASQLNLIYELVRPKEPVEDDTTDGDADTPTGDSDQSLGVDRFETEAAAIKYLAEQYYGRSDDNAIDLIEGHLRTANLPPVVQSTVQRYR